MAGGYAIARRTPKNIRTVLERNLIGLESSDLPSNIAFISANTKPICCICFVIIFLTNKRGLRVERVVGGGVG